MKKILVLLPLLACGSAFAEDPEDLDKTMQAIAKDLSALHWKLQEVYERELAVRADLSSYAAAVDLLNKAGVVTITADSADIFKGAALNAGVVESVSAGKKFPVLDKVGDWYAIALDKPVEGFSTGWVQAAKAVPYWDITAGAGVLSVADRAASQSLTDSLYSAATSLVTEIRRKYEADPLVRVSGFTVDVSIPPGVSVLFEFE